MKNCANCKRDLSEGVGICGFCFNPNPNFSEQIKDTKIYSDFNNSNHSNRESTKDQMKIEVTCTACKEKSQVKGERRGNTALEIILWLVAIIPGFIYSWWRFGKRIYRCPHCSCTHVKKSDTNLIDNKVPEYMYLILVVLIFGIILGIINLIQIINEEEALYMQSIDTIRSIEDIQKELRELDRMRNVLDSF